MCKFLSPKKFVHATPSFAIPNDKKTPLQWECNEAAMKKEREKKIERDKKSLLWRHTCASMSKTNLFHLDTSSFDFVGLLVLCWCLYFLVESFAFSFLFCSFTSKDRDLRMLSARLTKLKAHHDVLFDRPQILLGSPLSMLCFIVGWFVVFWEEVVIETCLLRQCDGHVYGCKVMH